MDLSEQAAKIVEIFAPDPESFGNYPSELVPSESKVGKLENPKKGTTYKKKWTLLQIENHLKGVGPRFGIVPISSITGTVKMFACDVDRGADGTEVYNKIDLPTLAKRLFKLHPMLFVLRSKSGGPHIYAFFRDPVLPGLVEPKMREIISLFGWGGVHEYFPKQKKIDLANNEFGNWINMPYYEAEQPIQYAFNPDTGEALTIDEFLAHAQLRAGTLEDFNAIELKGNDICTDGPPCIQRIFGEGVQINRNVTLRHLTTYLKSKYPDTWTVEMETYNNLFPEPVTATELTGIMKSVEKKNYGYSCDTEPMHSFCNKVLCNTRKFGVSHGAAHPFITSLTKHNSDPPIWWVYFDNGQKMRCDTESLQNTRGFQRMAMEQLNSVPPIYKQDQWTRVLGELMKNVTIVEVPESATAFGIMRQYIIDYLTLNSTGETYEELLNHKPVIVDNMYCFQLTSLMAWLSKKSFGLAKPEFITLVLGQMGANYRTQKVAATSRVIYLLPLDTVKGHNEELPMPNMEQPTAY